MAQEEENFRSLTLIEKAMEIYTNMQQTNDFVHASITACPQSRSHFRDPEKLFLARPQSKFRVS